MFTNHEMLLSYFLGSFSHNLFITFCCIYFSSGFRPSPALPALPVYFCSFSFPVTLSTKIADFHLVLFLLDILFSFLALALFSVCWLLKLSDFGSLRSCLEIALFVVALLCDLN